MSIDTAGSLRVDWSAGTGTQKVPLPVGAVDCHHHIYDMRYPTGPKATLRPADASLDDYCELQAKLGISRHVIVQPSPSHSPRYQRLCHRCKPVTSKGSQ